MSSRAGRPGLRDGAVLRGWMDTGADEHGSGSREMKKGFGKVLRFWSLPWGCGLVAGPGWGDYAESRANHRH